MEHSQTLYLIDCSSLIHRAFYAISGLTAPSGLPTNALYGLATMLRKFLREAKPIYCAAIFDAGRETFRTEMFEEYKSNRPKAPEELVRQFPYARRIASAMGLKVYEKEGFEADDIIATLTEAAVREGMAVVIESSDKDLFQLVGPKVVVHDPMREKTYDRKGVVEKLGVPPERVRDYLALVGDASDNVPGVPGIGPKGAADLIARFGGLEEIYEHIGEISGKRREALLGAREQAFLSRDLVTLRKDLDIPFDLQELRVREPDREEARKLWIELGFRTFLEEEGDSLPLMSQQSKVTGPEIEVIVLDEQKVPYFQEALRKAPKVALVASFEGRDPVEPKCRGVAVAVSPQEVFFLEPSMAISPLLRDEALLKKSVLPNYKFLYQAFLAKGLDLPCPGLEPLLAAYILHPERESPSVESLALEFLGEALPPSGDPKAQAIRASAIFRLSHLLEAKLEEYEQGKGLHDEVEVPLARVLAEMEATGVRVEPKRLLELSRDLQHRIEAVEKEIIDRAGCGPFNPNSPKQLAEVLFGKMQLPVVKKTKSGPSTDSEVLEVLADDPRANGVPQLVLEFRSLTKLKSTYADALGALVHPRTGRIHTSFNQMVTATGRLSSSDPNLQNIPIRTEEGLKIRRAFVAGDGMVFLSADYSQIELRVLAHLAEDHELMEAFQAGADIHARTASRIFGCKEEEVTKEMRRAAKTINFGVLYGMSAFRLSRDLKIDIHDAQKFINDYFAAFPGVRKYLDRVLEEARQKGYVTTLLGRRRAIVGLDDRNANVRGAAERMAINTPVQGSAADIIKVAMVRLWERLRNTGLRGKIVLQVHDELVLEVPKEEIEETEGAVREEMEKAIELKVPLKVDIAKGPNWADME